MVIFYSFLLTFTRPSSGHGAAARAVADRITLYGDGGPRQMHSSRPEFQEAGERNHGGC
jgi:hypothetical protein